MPRNTQNKEPRVYMSPKGWMVVGALGLAGLLFLQDCSGGNDPKPLHPMPSYPVPTPSSTSRETTTPVTPQKLRICDGIFADVGPSGVEELIIDPIVDQYNQPLDLSNPGSKKLATFPSARPRSEVQWFSEGGTPVAAPACRPLVGGVRPIDVHPAANQSVTETILVKSESKLANEAVVDFSLGSLVGRDEVAHQNIHVIPGTAIEEAIKELY